MVNEVYLNEDLCVASGLLAIFADKALLRIEKKKTRFLASICSFQAYGDSVVGENKYWIIN